MIDPPARAKMLLVSRPATMRWRWRWHRSARGTGRGRDCPARGAPEPGAIKTRPRPATMSLVDLRPVPAQAMPQANTLFIGALPPGRTWTWGDAVEAPQIIDVETSHPLMQLMDLGDVKFAESRRLAGADGRHGVGRQATPGRCLPLLRGGPSKMPCWAPTSWGGRRGTALCQYRLAVAVELPGVRAQRDAVFRQAGTPARRQTCSRGRRSPCAVPSRPRPWRSARPAARPCRWRGSWSGDSAFGTPTNWGSMNRRSPTATAAVCGQPV